MPTDAMLLTVKIKTNSGPMICLEDKLQDHSAMKGGVAKPK